MLMARVARKVDDRKILKLIRSYLETGVMVDGVKQPTVEGTPQGSPLSPILSNIMLDDWTGSCGHAVIGSCATPTIFGSSCAANGLPRGCSRALAA